MIGTNANFFGQLLGFLLPSIVITPKYVATNDYTFEQLEAYKDQVFILMLLYAIVGTITSLLVVFTLKSQPEQYQHVYHQEQVEKKEEQQTFCSQL
jgi:Na+/melibiose symporter-like transporter